MLNPATGSNVTRRSYRLHPGKSISHSEYYLDWKVAEENTLKNYTFNAIKHVVIVSDVTGSHRPPL